MQQHRGFPSSQGSPAPAPHRGRGPEGGSSPPSPPPPGPLSRWGGRYSVGGGVLWRPLSSLRRLWEAGSDPPHAHGPRFGERGRELAVTESSIQNQALIWSSASSWRQLFHCGGDQLTTTGRTSAPSPASPGGQSPPLLAPPSSPPPTVLVTFPSRQSAGAAPTPSPTLILHLSSPRTGTNPHGPPCTPPTSQHPCRPWGPPLLGTRRDAGPAREREDPSEQDARGGLFPQAVPHPHPAPLSAASFTGAVEVTRPRCLSDGPGF